MFCVECGKEEKIYKNGVCLPCYLKHAQFSKGPAILDIYLCPRCSSYKHKNTWIQEPFEKILRRHINDAFHISPELKHPHIETECKEQDKIYACKLAISGFLDDEQITEQHPLTVRIRRSTCDVCSREAGGYYEAILQIRVDQRTFAKTELTTLRTAVEKLVEQLQISGKRGLFITDISEKREGLDFFLSEKGTAQTIAKKIQEQYGGELKQSASNVGMKDSRQVYRMTYLVRIPSYRTGDFFPYRKSLYTISSIHGTKVRAIDLSKWEDIVIDGKDLQHTKILGGKDLVKEMIVVSQSKTELQLMDPKTYTMIELRKPKTMSITTPMVKTVKLNGQIFLFPEQSF